MGRRAPTVEETRTPGHQAVVGHHSGAHRKPAGRRPRPPVDVPDIVGPLAGVVRHCFPDLNAWFNAPRDPRWQPMCRYAQAHLFWQGVLTMLTRGGSRNGFDNVRNTGAVPHNVEVLCGQHWDETRLGPERTVTCGDNTARHFRRLDPAAVAVVPQAMTRALLEGRKLETARLFDNWYLVVFDGTVREHCREGIDDGSLRQTGADGQTVRYRYVVEARVLGPEGTTFPLATAFVDMHDPVRDKQDCELVAFQRLAEELHAAFPRLAICLLADGLYAATPVFDICDRYHWKFIVTFREGRQPNAWEEAMDLLALAPSHVWHATRKGDDGPVEQTARWVDDLSVGAHRLQAIFLGEIAPHAASLQVWLTNLRLDRERVPTIINEGGRKRHTIEDWINVLKNNGYGLEHVFCGHATASKNYYYVLLIADVLWQLLADGVLRRLLRHLIRKLTDLALVAYLRASLLYVRLPLDPPPIGQIRFSTA